MARRNKLAGRRAQTYYQDGAEMKRQNRLQHQRYLQRLAKERAEAGVTEFSIRGEYIELVKLLKAAGLVPTGGEGKNVVAEGRVTVDGEVETAKRKKIRPGQVVGFQGESIRVV